MSNERTEGMNEYALRWVEKLEDGTIEQAQGRLAEDEKRCCLGVACDQGVDDGLLVRKSFRSEGYGYVAPGSPVADKDLLPAVMVERLGLATRDGRFVNVTEGAVSLAALNDRGATFREIAAVIRSEPDGLFRA